MHYYQFNIGDYKRDTSHLTLLEHGVYRQLIDLYYLEEKPLDANALRLICARTAEEKECAQNMLDEFFTKLPNGTYQHDRCKKEMERIYEKSDKARVSAEKRWGKPNDANALPTHNESNANGMLPNNPLPNNPLPTKKTAPKKSSASDLPVPDFIPTELWADFMAMRKTIGATNSEAAVKLLITELKKIIAGGNDPIASIENSIRNSWKDVYAPKKQSGNAGNHREEARSVAAASIFKPEHTQHLNSSVQEANYEKLK